MTDDDDTFQHGELSVFLNLSKAGNLYVLPLTNISHDCFLVSSIICPAKSRKTTLPKTIDLILFFIVLLLF